MVNPRHKTGTVIFSLPSVIRWTFVILVFLPLVYTFFMAFAEGETFLSNLQQLNAETLLLLLKSGGIALSVALFSTVIGTILGFLLYKTEFPLKGLFKIALLIPLFLSPYIIAVAWKDLFFLLFHETGAISSAAGVIFVLTTIYTPLSILITGSAFANIDAQIEESALMTVRFRRALWSIILPLIKPAILSSFVLVFIFSISEFSVPAFFGVKVFTTEIFTQFSAFYNHALAIIQSTVLVIICVLLLIGERNYLADAPFLSISSEGNKTRTYKNVKYHILFVSVTGIYFIVSVVLPFTVLFVQAFKNGPEQFFKAFELLKPTFSTSLLLAFTGAAITMLIAVATVSNKQKTNKWFDMILLLTFAIPSIILGISLIKFYNHPALNFIYSSYAIIVIGYVAKFTFIAAKLIENAVRQVPPSLDEAAQIAGISKYARITGILLPIIRPALFGAFIISFIFNIGELGTTIMVYPPGTEIMPIKVYTIMANAPQTLTSSMTLIIFSVTLILISTFYLIVRSFVSKTPEI